MTEAFNFNRSYTYKEQAARSLTWGHHFLLLNILLAIFVGSAYVYAAPQSEGFLPFAYLILTLFGHMSFICCVLYLLLLFPLSFIGNFRAYRIIAVILALVFFAILLIDVKLYLYVKVHLSLAVLRLIFTQLDFNTGLNYNFLYIALPVVLIFELCFAKIATAYVYSNKATKLIFIRALIVLLTACFVSSHCIHIWADAVNYQQVTALRSAFPAHYPMTARSFLESHGWQITAVPADHDKREECLVYICKKNGKTFFYGHDTGIQLSDQAWELISAQHYDLISLDATMGKKTIGGYHMGLPDVETMLDKLTAQGCVDDHTVKVINHFSHNGEMTHDELTRWGAQRGILASYDGMEVEF